ncbi:NAD(P)-dependent oxidoreductase [Oceanobacillus jeddahense]|uniref:NAD(P)-dependent oxidoreductase n=1 Tax=Oceanobacillus jeddahense TaxID=1462527 RepID=UPI000A4FAFB5|nr:NAD(P)-dependent oxidoreductase [Oceanobacillus jeddahense]
MRILVIPHNHWVGYHIVTRLLDNGYQVDGIRSAQLNSGLEDFFGRNSHFQEVDQVKNDYDLAIIINQSEIKNLHEHTEKVILIQTVFDQNAVSDNSAASVISVPYLIGEGMELEENKVYADGELVSCSDEAWQKKAIYIKDFLNVFMQWIKMTHLPKLIEINSVNDNLTNTKVEKKQVLLENRDINTVIKAIQTFNKRLQ